MLLLALGFSKLEPLLLLLLLLYAMTMSGLFFHRFTLFGEGLLCLRAHSGLAQSLRRFSHAALGVLGDLWLVGLFVAVKGQPLPSVHYELEDLLI